MKNDAKQKAGTGYDPWQNSVKNNMLKRHDEVFNLWYHCGLSYQEIAKRKIPGNMSHKRISNIIYKGPGKLANDHEKEIYRMFRLKFLEIQDVAETIRYVHENQPGRTYSVSRIKNIIASTLKRRSIDLNTQPEK